jgi:UDPglucose--hexose-1-phosphate uridylyltransferase
MSEFRKDPVIDRWVIIATERSRRPNDFHAEAGGATFPTSHFNPFAPGHEDRTPPEVAAWGRPEGAGADTPGWKVRVVPNKFPVLQREGELDPQGLGMFDMMNGIGAHEVIIENPDAAWDIANATPDEMALVLDAYVARMKALQEDARFRYVLIFRNAGVAAGATLAHPHSQIIALPILPRQVSEKLEAARDYFARKGRCVFTDVIRQELAMGDRVVEETEHFVVLSPFAARFPFELQIYPRRHCHDFALITPAERDALAQVLPRSLRRIKNALGDPAYNLMLHTAPATHSTGYGTASQSGPFNSSQNFLWHIDILPRLTRVAGFEWGTGFYINPVSPENATEFLRGEG